MRDVFIKTLLQIAKKDKNVLLVTGDLGFGVLKPFWDELPKQIINVGIAEQNMIGFAAGLSMQGKVVYVYSIGNFPTLRPLEQIRNDIAYHSLNVKIVSVGSGLSYGSLGSSHHATEDIGIIGSIPNFTIYSPSTDKQTEYITKESYSSNLPCYIRLSRTSVIFQEIDEIEKNGIKSKSLIKFYSGSSNYAIITFGYILNNVHVALKKLKLLNINFVVYSFYKILPIESKIIKNILLKHNHIIIVEEHSTRFGFSSIIKSYVSSFNDINIYSIGINNAFVDNVGDQEYLLKLNSLDPESIFIKLMEIYDKSRK